MSHTFLCLCMSHNFLLQSQGQVITSASDQLAVNLRLPCPPPWIWLICCCGSQNSEKVNFLEYKNIESQEESNKSNDRANMWEGAFSMLFRGAYHSPSITICSATPELSEPRPFWTFMEASLLRHGWSNHWPLVIDSTPIPIPSLELINVIVSTVINYVDVYTFEMKWWKWQYTYVDFLSKTHYPSLIMRKGFPGSSVSKESTCNAGDASSVPGSGRSPGEGNGNPVRDPCLGNPMHRGAWWPIVRGVARVKRDLATKPPPPPTVRKHQTNPSGEGGLRWWSRVKGPHSDAQDIGLIPGQETKTAMGQLRPCASTREAPGTARNSLTTTTKTQYNHTHKQNTRRRGVYEIPVYLRTQRHQDKGSLRNSEAKGP